MRYLLSLMGGLLITGAMVLVLDYGLTGRWSLGEGIFHSDTALRVDGGEARDGGESNDDNHRRRATLPAASSYETVPAGTIYRWADPAGTIHFTEKRPPPEARDVSLLSARQLARQNVLPGPPPATTKPAPVPRQRQVPPPSRETLRKKLLEQVKPECRWPIGRAWEEERLLALARNPLESRWRDSYCKWIKEISDENCPVARADFDYEQICPYWRFRGRLVTSPSRPQRLSG